MVAEWLRRLYENGIVQNLVASALWVSLVTAGIYLTRLQRFRRWWRIPAAKGSVIRFVSGTWDTPVTSLGYPHAVTTAGDAAAISYAAAGITLAFGSKYRIRAYCDESFHSSFWDDIVVLIGGRVRNDATKDLLRILDESWIVPFAILDLDVPVRTITDVTTGTVYRSEFSGGRIVKDYGVLSRLPNPFTENPLSPVFLFYGLHSFGTVGAAKFVAPEYVRQLAASHTARTRRWCQVLVSVEVRDEEVYPRIELVRDLSPKPGKVRANRVSLRIPRSRWKPGVSAWRLSSSVAGRRWWSGRR